MANDGKYDMPGEMRAFAEKGLEQARTAFDAFVTAAQQAATVTQTQVRRRRLYGLTLPIRQRRRAYG